jgi:hypothetical protein
MVSSNTRNKVRLLFAIAAATTFFLSKQQASRMDDDLFQRSVQGANALIHYELGDFNGAARAYRAHFKTAYESGDTSGNPSMDWFLAEATQHAKEWALSTLVKDPDTRQTRRGLRGFN